MDRLSKKYDKLATVFEAYAKILNMQKSNQR